MKAYRWDPDTNAALAAGRRISFDRIVVAADDCAYLVPFVDEEDYFFLKTITPSRKATNMFLKPAERDAEH